MSPTATTQTFETRWRKTEDDLSKNVKTNEAEVINIVNMLTESCRNHQRHYHKHYHCNGRQRDKKISSESTKCEESSDNSKEQKQHVGRVLRNRCYRRPFEDHRHTKRLFTPEIKRFLKSWLVRRRDNPYPSRDEKKGLAVQTGLTYIQICNWFANWRRKLKNAGTETQHSTWGNLIKSYNIKAHGNVEQFSLCSDDSIWEEQELSDPDEDGDGTSTSPSLSYVINAAAMDHSYSALFHRDNDKQVAKPNECLNLTIAHNQDTLANNKYKNLIMKKYLSDLKLNTNSSGTTGETGATCSSTTQHPVQLSKWLESAAKYKPGQSYITWSARNITWHNTTVFKNQTFRKEISFSGINGKKYLISKFISQPTEGAGMNEGDICLSGHQREELDAAEALTRLSSLH
ncbi:hypothetical protein L9F63_021428 [Diploptera punctata]|uniref:Homeobox domain-containing protein n=1 Tax=Diploptera punctata TaxID=6984 RepID=A0AAD7ZPB7_DIPPU|nr:hypothetical protein L9F63_021428 [Diploptera punctata]